MIKFTDLNHPFHMTGISEFVKLPKHQNDITVFHGLKTKERLTDVIKTFAVLKKLSNDIILQISLSTMEYPNVPPSVNLLKPMMTVNFNYFIN
jgi:hypothetical protein